MPLCSTCHTEQPLEEFYADNHRTVGHGSQCKGCTRNRKSSKAQIELAKMRQYLILKGCLGCGNRDVRVLDFDHIYERTGYVVSLVTKYGWEHTRTQHEVAKCDVRCANCHRIRHWNERNQSGTAS